jgi:uncharacterized protein (DUF1778 family)
VSRRLLYTAGMPETTKSIRLDMRISPGDKELFQRAADQDGRTLSDWIRHRLLRTARQELGESGGKGKAKRRPSP